MRLVFVGVLVVLGGLPFHVLAQHGMIMPAAQPTPAREPFRTVKTVNGRRIVVYQLYITDTTVNYTGRRRHAIAVNGLIPGPALEFTEGDTAEIHIHNEMMMETSVHWHGQRLPNGMDGVSGLNQPPIKPGQPSEPPRESPPGNPRPEVPPPMQDPGEPPRPEELPGRTPDELPARGPQGPRAPTAAAMNP